MALDIEIGTYADLVKDHRSVLKLIIDPLQIYEIAAYHEEKRYLVFNVSKWLDHDDLGKDVVPVSSRDLKDAPAFFFNSCRDQMFNLRVDIRGKPAYIIEPRVSAARWVAARLGLPNRDAWKIAVLGGRLHTALRAGNPVKLEEQLETATKEARTQGKRLRRRDAELVALKNTEMILEKKHSETLGTLGQVADEAKVRSNQVRAQDARIRQLEKALRDGGIPLPSRNPPPPWNP